MIRTILTTVIVTLALALMAAFAIAQEPILVNYQGQLNGTDGEPVPDGSYEVSFSLFDDPTEGTLLWMEVHPEVQTSNGMFSVQLGGIEPINLRTFETEILALELQVENDIPMWPRIRLTAVPTAAVAQRVNGDIITEQSTLRIYPPDPNDPAGIQLSVNEEEIGMAIQGIPGGPTAGMAVTLTVDWEDAAIIVQNIPEGETTGPTVQLIASATMADIMLENLPSAGGPPGSSMSLMTNNGEAEFSMQALPSPGETGPTVEILVDDLMADLTLQNLPSPGEPGPTIALMANSSMADIMLENLPAVGGPAGSSISLMSNNGEAEILVQALPSPGNTSGAAELKAGPLGSSFQLGGPQNGGLRLEITDPILEFTADESNGNFRMYSPDLGADVGPIMDMNSGIGGSWSWRLFNPQPEPPGRPVMEMNSGPGGEYSWLMFNPQPEPPGRAIMEMKTDINGPNFSMTAPQYSGASAEITNPILEMAVVNDLGRFRMYDPDIGPDDGAIMDMGTGVGGSWSWRLFNPQPEPPGRPVMEMNSGPGGEYSWLMFNPQPEPPGRAIMEMSTSLEGPSFKMTSPQPEGGGLEITDPLLEITADNTGARIKLFDTGGGTTVEISNDGDVEARRGNFGSGNTLTGSYAFVAGSFNTVGGQEAFAAGESNTVNGFRATILGGDNNTANGMRSTVCGGSYNSVYATSAVIPGGYNSTINAGASYSCLIGIDASLSEDSTFMVDLPHIRFGDETDGYEFPTADGGADQVMITDGSGQLSWADLARISGDEIGGLANTIEELKRQNSELERRINKLEAERR